MSETQSDTEFRLRPTPPSDQPAVPAGSPGAGAPVAVPNTPDAGTVPPDGAAETRAAARAVLEKFGVQFTEQDVEAVAGTSTARGLREEAAALADAGEEVQRGYDGLVGFSRMVANKPRLL